MNAVVCCWGPASRRRSIISGLWTTYQDAAAARDAPPVCLCPSGHQTSVGSPQCHHGWCRPRQEADDAPHEGRVHSAYGGQEGAIAGEQAWALPLHRLDFHKLCGPGQVSYPLWATNCGCSSASLAWVRTVMKTYEHYHCGRLPRARVFDPELSLLCSLQTQAAPRGGGSLLLTQVPGTGSHTVGSGQDPAGLSLNSPGSRWVGEEGHRWAPNPAPQAGHCHPLAGPHDQPQHQRPP